jgi:DNA-binding NarL/FixJ family response regulator
MRPRVVIVDDHTLVADACRLLVGPACDVVGTFSEPRSFLERVETLRPDVVILDVSMPSLNGLDTARALLQQLPDVRVIMLTMNEDPDVAAEAFRVGAHGYVLKRSVGSELPLAVREVMAHRYYVTPLITRDLVGSLARDPHARKAVHQLTPRQREVLQLLAEGRSMKEAAAVLHVSARTVAFHKYRMMEQLQVHSTAALIQFAVREGLV